jgi:hypothetical protein
MVTAVGRCRIGVVGVRRLVATSVVLTALLVGGCEPAAPKTSPVFPATSSPATPAISRATSPATPAISPPTIDSNTVLAPNPCQLLTLADVRQVYPAASPAPELSPVYLSVSGIPSHMLAAATACGYVTGLPVGSERPTVVGVIVWPDDDAAWARDMTDTINSGLATPVPGLADAIITPSATGGTVHRGAWRAQILFVSPSGDPAVMTLFLGAVASRL